MNATQITRVIGVNDLARATSFYREVFGLTVTSETPYWVDLTCGDGNLALQPYRHDADALVHTMVIFTVDDLDGAVADAEKHGGVVHQRVDNPHAPVVLAHVIDTENNVIQIAAKR